jgi:PAS domain S-box-containing protein
LQSLQKEEEHTLYSDFINIIGDLMKDDNKTKKQLLRELTELRSQNTALEKSITGSISTELAAAEALRESDALLHSLIDYMHDAMIILNWDGSILFANRAAARIIEFERPEEFLGHNMIEYLHPDSFQKAAEDLEAVKADKMGFLSEYQLCSVTGRRIWVESIGGKIIFRNASANLVCIRDITERKRAEEALRESEEKYRWVVDNMADVITVMDMNLRFTYVSPSIMRMRGYTAEEATAQTFEQVMTPESLQIVAKVFEEEMKLEASGTADPGRSRILEVEQYRKDGSIVWMENHLSFLRDEAQKAVGIISLSRDITDRKRAEEALRESEELFRSYLENAPDGIYMSDLEGNFLYGNRKCEEIIGYRREELIGKNFLELNILSENSLNKAIQLLRANMEGKSTGPDEIELISKGGRLIPVEINTNVVQHLGQKIVIASVRDITERKKAEERLQETLESLRKALGTTIQVMVSAVESRDPYTAGHQVRSANLARCIATEMGLPQEKIEGLRMAGSIHDIGKLSIPAEILSKPTKLTNIEFSLIKEHSRKGYEMLKDVESPWPLADIVYQHHERMDGSGYPRNLKGDDILMEARIMAVADVVEAMASHRPYRPGLGIDAALNEIEKNRGTFYDDAVAGACLKLFKEKRYNLE